MIGDISVCKSNVVKLEVPVELLIYAISFQPMFEKSICRAYILVGMKVEGWKTFDRNLGSKLQILSCLVNNAKH